MNFAYDSSDEEYLDDLMLRMQQQQHQQQQQGHRNKQRQGHRLDQCPGQQPGSYGNDECDDAPGESQSQQNLKRKQKPLSTPSIPSSTPASSPPYPPNICKLPGCDSPVVYVDERTGQPYDYCRRTHAKQHITMNRRARHHHSQDHDDSSSESASTVMEWACAMCTYRNVNVVPRCEMCESPRTVAVNAAVDPISTVPQPPPARVVTALVATVQGYCSECTFVNPPTHQYCGVCYALLAPKQTTSSAGASSSSLSSTSLSGGAVLTERQLQEQKYNEMMDHVKQISYWDEEERKQVTWQCATCDTINSIADDPVCTQCQEGQTIPMDRKYRSCPVCTLDNVVTETVCVSCNHVFSSDPVVNPHELSIEAKAELIKSGARRVVCAIPGCRKLSEPDCFGFCSDAHRQKGMHKQIVAPIEMGVELELVGGTGDFTVQLLNKFHPKRESVKRQFLDGWTKTESGRPTVERIYCIRVSPIILEKFDACKKKFGNVVRRFHGTDQLPRCMFGTNQSTPPCLDPMCRVCSICRQSFRLSQVRTGADSRNWNSALRYGPGLYFAPQSSKSNDYNDNSERIRPAQYRQTRRWRCMFLCNVVVGKAFTTDEHMLPEDQCPPPGYQSIIGVKGKALNYDEVVVYGQDQAIPSYLIVYSLHSK
jgi:hypothetical protein